MVLRTLDACVVPLITLFEILETHSTHPKKLFFRNLKFITFNRWINRSSIHAQKCGRVHCWNCNWGVSSESFVSAVSPISTGVAVELDLEGLQGILYCVYIKKNSFKKFNDNLRCSRWIKKIISLHYKSHKFSNTNGWMTKFFLACHQSVTFSSVWNCDLSFQNEKGYYRLKSKYIYAVDVVLLPSCPSPLWRGPLLRPITEGLVSDDARDWLSKLAAELLLLEVFPPNSTVIRIPHKWLQMFMNYLAIKLTHSCSFRFRIPISDSNPIPELGSWDKNLYPTPRSVKSSVYHNVAIWFGVQIGIWIRQCKYALRLCQ